MVSDFIREALFIDNLDTMKEYEKKILAINPKAFDK